MTDKIVVHTPRSAAGWSKKAPIREAVVKAGEVRMNGLFLAEPPDGQEALRERLARLPDPSAAGGLLLVEAICTHFTGHDIEVEEGARVMVEADSTELEG